MPETRESDPEFDLELRHRLDLDRRDEEWDGVYRMSPSPAPEHARIVIEFAIFLGRCIKPGPGGTLFAETNIFRDASPNRDYRVPDLTWVSVSRKAVVGENGIHGIGPDAVVEIRSPGDDTDAKIPFYLGIGVREVLIVDRDSKVPEIHRLSGGVPVRIPSQDGWVRSEVFQAKFRQRPGEPNCLEAEDLRDPANRAVI